MQARTRVLDIEAANATRIMKAAEGVTASVTAEVAEKSKTQTDEAVAVKAGVGKNTVLHMLSEERKAVSRSWMSAVAGLGAFIVLAGGAFYWKHLNDGAAQQEALDRVRQREQETRASNENFQKAIGMRAQDVVQRFGSATVFLNVHWRLYDRATGKPIFHKVIEIDGKKYPAYVRLPGNLGVVRWLTLEDDFRSNLAIGSEHTGTGFVVGEQGFILTNKHVAASWTLNYSDSTASSTGFLFEYRGGPGLNASIETLKTQIKRGRDANGKRLGADDVAKMEAEIRRLEPLTKAQIINTNEGRYRDLASWVPETGGFIFPSSPLIAEPIGDWNIADPSSNQKRNFAGRNEVLEVKFAGSRLAVNANLLRISGESDAALIKIDTPQPLAKLELANEEPRQAEDVIVMGYPAIARSTQGTATSEVIENGQRRVLTDVVLEPYVTNGIISAISPATRTENGVTIRSALGDIIQLSINSAGAGNSGGPVFNKDGKVIGLYTYGIQRGGASSSGAVPIKYGRDLLQSQRP